MRSPFCRFVLYIYQQPNYEVISRKESLATSRNNPAPKWWMRIDRAVKSSPNAFHKNICSPDTARTKRRCGGDFTVWPHSDRAAESSWPRQHRVSGTWGDNRVCVICLDQEWFVCFKMINIIMWLKTAEVNFRFLSQCKYLLIIEGLLRRGRFSSTDRPQGV